MRQVRTGISTAYWCNPAKGHAFEPARLPIAHDKGEPTAWFDELFLGGLKVPDGDDKSALTLLLTGPPGIGKSTLALELCCRLAVTEGMKASYYSTEGHAPWLVTHAKEFGWDQTDGTLIGEGAKNKVRIVSIRSRADFQDVERNERELQGAERRSSVELPALRTILPFLDQEPDRGGSGGESRKARDIFVIDNLNTATVDHGQWFNALKTLEAGGVRLVIVVHDSAENDGSGREWDYLADVVIGLDRTYPGGYMIRTIEIMKARYQQSVSGRHQFKILKKTEVIKDDPLRIRHHPYHEQGGVFIYPSMHFLLSRYNFMHVPHGQSRVPSQFPALNHLLKEGFPAGRCVALVGGRGTHKSRVAFSQVLHTLYSDQDAHASIISLGDDEESTLGILRTIHHQEFHERPSVQTLIDTGRLELDYYPPGFITPEEFFHRMQLSVARQRASSRTGRVLLVFNSLDLLSSHFPLCSEHKVFIPAMVEVLGYQGVTSFFVAPTIDREVHQDDHGLLSMADPILRFSRDVVSKKDFMSRGVPKTIGTKLGRTLPALMTIVRMDVDRFAAGDSAGQAATLILAPETDTALGLRPGLHVYSTKPLAKTSNSDR